MINYDYALSAIFWVFSVILNMSINISPLIRTTIGQRMKIRIPCRIASYFIHMITAIIGHIMIQIIVNTLMIDGKIKKSKS
jgi:hypothetical protein